MGRAAAEASKLRRPSRSSRTARGKGSFPAAERLHEAVRAGGSWSRRGSSRLVSLAFSATRLRCRRCGGGCRAVLRFSGGRSNAGRRASAAAAVRTAHAQGRNCRGTRSGRRQGEGAAAALSAAATDPDPPAPAVAASVNAALAASLQGRARRRGGILSARSDDACSSGCRRRCAGHADAAPPVSCRRACEDSHPRRSGGGASGQGRCANLRDAKRAGLLPAVRQAARGDADDQRGRRDRASAREARRKTAPARTAGAFGCGTQSEGSRRRGERRRGSFERDGSFRFRGGGECRRRGRTQPRGRSASAQFRA